MRPSPERAAYQRYVAPSGLVLIANADPGLTPLGYVLSAASRLGNTPLRAGKKLLSLRSLPCKLPPMQCPKCHFEHEDRATECVKCGIVFAKFAEHQKYAEVQRKFEKEDEEEAAELRQELTSRFLARPLALIFARFAAGQYSS